MTRNASLWTLGAAALLLHTGFDASAREPKKLLTSSGIAEFTTGWRGHITQVDTYSDSKTLSYLVDGKQFWCNHSEVRSIWTDDGRWTYDVPTRTLVLNERKYRPTQPRTPGIVLKPEPRKDESDTEYRKQALLRIRPKGDVNIDGFVISWVDPDGPAAFARSDADRSLTVLEPGDIILTVGKTKFNDLREFNDLLNLEFRENRETIRFTARDGKTGEVFSAHTRADVQERNVPVAIDGSRVSERYYASKGSLLDRVAKAATNIKKAWDDLPPEDKEAIKDIGRIIKEWDENRAAKQRERIGQAMRDTYTLGDNVTDISPLELWTGKIMKIDGDTYTIRITWFNKALKKLSDARYIEGESYLFSKGEFRK